MCLLVFYREEFSTKQACIELVTELIKLNRNYQKYYQRNLKVMKFIRICILAFFVVLLGTKNN